MYRNPLAVIARRVFLCCAGVLFPFCSSQAPAQTSADLSGEAGKAYQAKDYARFVDYERRALAMEPNNALFIYNLACGESLLGHAAEAVKLLDQLIARKLDLGATTEHDFDPIRSTPEWAGLESRLNDLRKPLVRSRIAFTLPEAGLFASGIAVDPATGNTYIASVLQRRILRRNKSGVVTDFVSQGRDGFLAGGSLAVDTERNLLYATTSAMPAMAGYTQQDEGRSGVFAFDLKSGKLVRKIFLDRDGKPHFLNAMAIDRAGNVYVSDSGTTGIYRLLPKAATLEPFQTAGVLRSTQGLALSAEEKILYVADFGGSIWAIDLLSGRPRRLELPAGAWLRGIDGLALVPGGFVAVQIGLQPNRVVKLHLDSKGNAIEQVEILEMSHPSYFDPVQGVVVNGVFLYIADSQLGLLNEFKDAQSVVKQKMRETVVLSLPLH